MSVDRTWNFTILGAPRTKKNHGHIATVKGKPRMFPSKQWTRWKAAHVIVGKRPVRLELDVNCKAIFYRDANRGDAVGYYQGLADLLEHDCIVENDKHIVSWDGSRMLVDRERPRVEVELMVTHQGGRD